jgi:hypothetical protein
MVGNTVRNYIFEKCFEIRNISRHFRNDVFRSLSENLPFWHFENCFRELPFSLNPADSSTYRDSRGIYLAYQKNRALFSFPPKLISWQTILCSKTPAKNLQRFWEIFYSELFVTTLAAGTPGTTWGWPLIR